jgi:hypothetical protein
MGKKSSSHRPTLHNKVIKILLQQTHGNSIYVHTRFEAFAAIVSPSTLDNE